MTTKIKTINPDGTVETTTEDTRSIQEKLQGELTWAQKLDAMFPTTEADITKGWAEYDNHNLFK